MIAFLHGERDFLGALGAQPSDLTAWLAYGDWLEERAEPARAEYVRACAALARGELTAEASATAMRRLAELAGAASVAWLEEVTRLRGGLPMRIRVSDYQLLGNDPPRAMLDRMMTFIYGELESGTVRFGDVVAIPLEDGGELVKPVRYLFTLQTQFTEVSAGRT